MLNFLKVLFMLFISIVIVIKIIGIIYIFVKGGILAGCLVLGVVIAIALILNRVVK